MAPRLERRLVEKSVFNASVDPVENEPRSVVHRVPERASVDGHTLGQVGVTNASPPGQLNAWLSVRPDGSVVYYDQDGQLVSRGKWYGCSGPAIRTCTLVTQMLTLRDTALRANSSVSVGVGVGVGF